MKKYEEKKGISHSHLENRQGIFLPNYSVLNLSFIDIPPNRVKTLVEERLGTVLHGQ